jgi:translocator protein
VNARSVIGLAGFILLTLAIGAIGARATLPEIPGWYAQLAKPSFTPPNWVFGPVWTTLYVLMAIAAWLVWRKGAPARTRALAAWSVQLALNVAWSLLFFGAHRIELALFDVVLLLLAIAATVILFAPLSRAAAMLLLPYFVWVAYATALNFAVWRLNT